MSSLSPRTPGPVVEGSPAHGGTSPFAAGRPRVAAADGAPEPPRFNWQVMRSLRMYPMLAAGVATAVCLLLVLMAFQQSRVYKAESRVFVDPLVPGSISPSNGQPGYDQFRYGSYLDQQIQTVTRADILTAALRAVPAGTWRGAKESEQSAVARLQKALVVERLTDGYEFSIKLSTPNPQASAAMLNAVANAYLQGGRKDELTQADGRQQILVEERQRIKEALDADQREQASLGTNLGVANPASEGGNPFDLQLNNLRTQLEVARESHDVAAAQLSAMVGTADSRAPGLVSAADDSLTTDAGLSSMKASINQRRAILKGLMANMTPGNPLYKQDQDELADLDRLLDAETVKMRGAAERRIQDRLRTDLQRTAGVEAQLNAQLSEQTAKATSAGPKLLRARELDTDIKRLNERYTEVDAALHALQLETNGPGLAHVTLKAAAPLAPEPNRRALFLLAALPLGIFSGAASAVVARLRGKRIYIGADLEETIGFPPLAVLPARSDVPARVVEEYTLRMAAGVEGAYRNTSARTFTMSAISGRSNIHSLVQALAARLEDLRLNVLVLRAAELLTTSQQTAEHLAAASRSRVTSHGSDHPHSRDGIATAKLDRLKESYDLILIDAEPLLHAAETEYAARCTDATILIAESSVTRSNEVEQASALLSRLQVHGVAVVLDQVRLRDADEVFKEAIQVVERRSVDAAAERKARPSVRIITTSTQEFATAQEPENFASGPVVVDHSPAEQPDHSPVLHEASFLSDESAPVAIEPPTAAARIDMPAEPPYVPDLFSNPSIQPVAPEEKIAVRHFRRESDYAGPSSADPRVNLIRPVRPGARRADGTPIPSAFSEQPAAAPPLPQTESPVANEVNVAPAPPPPVPSPAFAHDEPTAAADVPDIPVPSPEEEVSPATSQEEPSYTRSRSRIRFAFKEEKVNSKTTWFGKLFGGDPPSSFKIIPNDEEAGNEDGEWTPLERQPAAVTPESEPAAAIVPTVDTEPHEVWEPLPVGAPAVNLIEARDALAPVALGASRAARPIVPEAILEAVHQPAPGIVASFPPVAALEPAHVTPPAELTGSLRPLRPLTFQQLAGEEVPAQVAMIEESSASVISSAPSVEAAGVPVLWPEKAPAVPSPSTFQSLRAPAEATIETSRTEARESGAQPPIFHPIAATSSRPMLQRLISKLEAVPSQLPIHHAPPAHVPAVMARGLGASSEVSLTQPSREVAQPGHGLSRRWALLSQFDPSATDPVPSGRKVPGPHFAESNPRPDNEG